VQRTSILKPDLKTAESATATLRCALLASVSVVENFLPATGRDAECAVHGEKRSRDGGAREAATSARSIGASDAMATTRLGDRCGAGRTSSLYRCDAAHAGDSEARGVSTRRKTRYDCVSLRFRTSSCVNATDRSGTN
jgi:hypothetical protein